jgi:GDPmannose 4,6-dehydratase
VSAELLHAGSCRPHQKPGKVSDAFKDCENSKRKSQLTKKVLITGITGQDGSYLAEHLLELGYEVHGLVRRVALENPERRFDRIGHILDRLILHPASLESYPSLFHVVSQNDFDECYHLAAQSFVAESFADGFSTMNTNINGTHYMLAALRELRPQCRFYFAGSSEMFGKTRESPQCESTPFYPRSPYGISKVAGFELTRNYREAYGMNCAWAISMQSAIGGTRLTMSGQCILCCSSRSRMIM